MKNNFTLPQIHKWVIKINMNKILLILLITTFCFSCSKEKQDRTTIYGIKRPVPHILTIPNPSKYRIMNGDNAGNPSGVNAGYRIYRIS